MGTPFDIEHQPLIGARVVLNGKPLSSACMSEGEVDDQINALKVDLDRVGVKMKAALRAPKKSLFRESASE